MLSMCSVGCREMGWWMYMDEAPNTTQLHLQAEIPLLQRVLGGERY